MLFVQSTTYTNRNAELAESAKELGVEEQWIGEVETWKGREDLTKGSLNSEEWSSCNREGLRR